ncbi:MAG: methyl-accepting chemotaxis protein [Bryobacteraceae bacterium]|jgi:methyl-accepting chemotaxis protein
MNWYRNLPTAAKLMLAFGLMAALIGFVGYEGVSASHTINNMLDALYQHDMVGAVLVKDAMFRLATLSTTHRQSVLETDPAKLQALPQKGATLLRQIDEDLDNAEKTVHNDQARDLLGRIRQALPEYRQHATAVLQLAAAGQKDAAAAQAAQGTAYREQLQNALEDWATLNDKLGKQAYDDSDAVYNAARRMQIGSILAAILLAGGLGYFVARQIARPLQRMVAVATRLAEGDLGQKLDYRSRDEAGQLAEAFREMIAGFSNPVKEAAAVLARVADRDLTARMAGDCKGDFAPIKASVNDAVENLNAALLEVRSSSAEVASTAQQVSAASEELSGGTQRQAASQEETSATIEELTSTVRQNAENAREANQLALSARQAADNGGEVVRSAVTAMGEINSASRRIADIITTIDEIAFQTNLLALNAAVEAARAGEQGRGFAVVASEVRSLAQRSASAAKEIKTLIQDSVRKVENGSELVNRSGQTLTEIVAAVKRVTDIVAEIAAASSEQATGIEQVSKAMVQMDQVTQSNAAQTEELASTAEELSSTAEQLSALAARFALGSGDSAPAERRPRRSGAAPQSTGTSLARLAQHTGNRQQQFREA